MDRLFATAQILFFQTGNGLVQRCLVEVLGLCQTKCFKVFLDGIVLQHFRAGNIERADGRTLNHGQQDLIVHGFDANVVKETGCVEFFDDFFTARIIEIITDFNGQVIEDGTRLGALQTFDADVLNGKVSQCHWRQAQYH